MNMEISYLLGSGELSGYGVSFAADNRSGWGTSGRRGPRCGISIFKARGMRYATDVRRLDLRRGRDRIGSGFAGLRGVLTGLPKRPRTTIAKRQSGDRGAEPDALDVDAGPGVRRRRGRAPATRPRADPRGRPYERCAMLEAQLGQAPTAVLVPEATPEDLGSSC